jgi:hypothetical protein
LIGANRAYLQSTLPELARLLVASLDQVRAAREVVVIAGTHPEFAGVARKLKRDQTASALVGLLHRPPAARVRIEGLCW